MVLQTALTVAFSLMSCYDVKAMLQTAMAIKPSDINAIQPRNDVIVVFNGITVLGHGN